MGEPVRGGVAAGSRYINCVLGSSVLKSPGDQAEAAASMYT